MKENVEKNCLFGKQLLSAFGKHFIMALKTFCIQIFKSGSVYSSARKCFYLFRTIKT